jgi:hypothetical protein
MKPNEHPRYHSYKAKFKKKKLSFIEKNYVVYREHHSLKMVFTVKN